MRRAVRPMVSIEVPEESTTVWLFTRVPIVVQAVGSTPGYNRGVPVICCVPSRSIAYSRAAQCGRSVQVCCRVGRGESFGEPTRASRNDGEPISIRRRTVACRRATNAVHRCPREEFVQNAFWEQNNNVVLISIFLPFAAYNNRFKNVLIFVL